MSQGPFGIIAAVLLEVGVFPTLVDSLAVEVISVEVLLVFIVEKTNKQQQQTNNNNNNKLPDIHQKLSRYPSTDQLD